MYAAHNIIGAKLLCTHIHRHLYSVCICLSLWVEEPDNSPNIHIHINISFSFSFGFRFTDLSRMLSGFSRGRLITWAAHLIYRLFALFPLFHHHSLACSLSLSMIPEFRAFQVLNNISRVYFVYPISYSIFWVAS